MRQSAFIKSALTAGYFSLGAAIAHAAGAQAADSTNKQPQTERTLSNMIRVRAMHFAMGAASVPYLDKEGGGSAVEIRVGISFKALPDWTFTFAEGAVSNMDTTAYVAPGSSGFHPRLSSLTQSFEVQRRWKNASMLHPLATAAIGSLTTSYNYVEYPHQGVVIRHTDEKTTSTLYSLAAGGELNIARWLRATLTLGYRHAAATKLLASTTSNSGLVVTSLFELGKF